MAVQHMSAKHSTTHTQLPQVEAAMHTLHIQINYRDAGAYVADVLARTSKTTVGQSCASHVQGDNTKTY